MNYADNGRARDARMMNGAMSLGGRNPTSFEVDFALGLNGGHRPLPGLGAPLAQILRFWRWMRSATGLGKAANLPQIASHKA